MQEAKSDFKAPPPFWSWYLLPAGLADGGGKHELPPKFAKVDGEVHIGGSACARLLKAPCISAM